MSQRPVPRRKAHLPGIPLTGVKDPAVLAALKALSERVYRREGESTLADQKDRFVTLRELEEGVQYNTRIRRAVASAAASENTHPMGQLQSLGVVQVNRNEVVLDWESAAAWPGYSHIEVWRGTTGDYGAATLVGDTKTYTYTDTAPEYGTTYYYWVRAVNTQGQAGPFSDPVQATTEFSPYIVDPPTALTVASGTDHLLLAGDGTIISRIYSTWDASTHAFFDRYEVQYKKSTDTVWSAIERTTDPGFYIAGIQDGVAYDIRVRTATDVAASDWTTQLAHTVVGKTEPPPDITAFAAQQNGGSLVMNWRQVTGTPDLAGYEIRAGRTGSSSWDNSILLTRETRGTAITDASLSPGLWDIYIKAVDTSGNYSVNPSVVEGLRFISDYDIIASVEQHPTWRGLTPEYVEHHTGVLVEKSMSLASSIGWGVFDEYVPHPIGAGSSGFVRYYTGAVLVPQSSVLASELGWEVFDKFVPSPVQYSYYEALELDSDYDDPVRTWAEIGSTPGPGETSGQVRPSLQIDYRLDGDLFSDSWQEWVVGNVEARYVKQRIRLENVEGNVDLLQTHTVVVDLLERTERHNDVTITAGGTAVTFDDPFHLTPHVTAMATGAAARYITRDALTTSGVTFHVFDGAGNDVGGVIDYEVKGV